MGLDQSVEDRHMEVGQDVIRLRRLGFMILSGEDTHFLTRFSQVLDGSAGRCGKAVSGRIEIIDDKEDFHAWRG